MDRLPIEPLDKARWDRIERSLEEYVRRSPSDPTPAAPRFSIWRPMLALALVGAASTAGVIAWQTRSPKPTITAASVTRIETDDSASHVDLGGASLDVAAHSSARIEGTDETGVVVTLARGAVECDVAPRHERPPFVVRAGEVSVRVVGTHFRVERAGDETHVSVQRGTVEVDSHGATSVVRAGTMWPAPPEATTTASRTAPPLTATTSTVRIPTPPPSATAVTPSPRERYDRALALEASRPEEALALYGELAQGDGPWAMNALYAAGRFELERGNKDVARAKFAEYLRRFPNGPNATDARDLAAKLQ